MLVIGESGLSVSRVLCLGAHADDIEIGCGGTLMVLLARQPGVAVDWVVLSADDERERETRGAADRLLDQAGERSVTVERFRERYFPYDPALKEFFDELGQGRCPTWCSSRGAATHTRIIGLCPSWPPTRSATS